MTNGRNAVEFIVSVLFVLAVYLFFSRRSNTGIMSPARIDRLVYVDLVGMKWTSSEQKDRTQFFAHGSGERTEIHYTFEVRWEAGKETRSEYVQIAFLQTRHPNIRYTFRNGALESALTAMEELAINNKVRYYAARTLQAIRQDLKKARTGLPT